MRRAQSLLTVLSVAAFLLVAALQAWPAVQIEAHGLRHTRGDHHGRRLPAVDRRFGRGSR